MKVKLFALTPFLLLPFDDKGELAVNFQFYFGETEIKLGFGLFILRGIFPPSLT